MTAVCIGCGLTTDNTGKLIIATSGSWPLPTDHHSACCATTRDDNTTAGADTLGGLVYCASDGKLRTYPRQHIVSTFASHADSYSSSAGNVENTHDTSVLQLALTNPSAALGMCGMVWFTAFHEVTWLADSSFSIVFKCDTGDGSGYDDIGVRSPDGSGNGATKTEIWRPTVPLNVCLDPGQTKTMRFIVETHKASGASGPNVVTVNESAREIRALLMNI